MATKQPRPKPNISTLRPPVIAVMGHIDHGKSTLLDYIRKTNIVDKEAGGITQHVGAYEVLHKTKDGSIKKITFLDTPGHEAFKGIRARGADVADIAVLVVSAEEGVKPQTLEALACIKESQTPYIVAINKIDKPGADIEKTKQNLAENEIYLEGYGGAIPFVPISAKVGTGVDDLLDMMLLVAELEELTGDTTKPAEGVIIEARLDRKKGMTATLVVRDGTLKVGQFIVAGNALASVRSIESITGERLETATFSTPVRIAGWNAAPKAGSVFVSADTKKLAEELCSTISTALPKTKKTTDEEDLRTRIDLVLKADTLGSLEAIEHEISKLQSEKLNIKIIGKGIGAISESDVKSAMGMKDPIVLGFNSGIDTQTKGLGERLGIHIETFDIIYKLVEWLDLEAKKRIPKEAHDDVTGSARILKIFSKDKDRQIIGGRIENGVITSGANFKIMRRDFEVGRGKIRGLEHMKAKVDEVKKGMEFGTMAEAKIEIAVGDTLETFVTTLS